MSNTYWVELPLTVQGRRQPMDNLVRQLHEAGFMARCIRDFCTGASEKELCMENPDDDSYANRVLACRVGGKSSREALRAYAERHADLFRPVRENGNRASEREDSYLNYSSGRYTISTPAPSALPRARRQGRKRTGRAIPTGRTSTARCALTS